MRWPGVLLVVTAHVASNARALRVVLNIDGGPQTIDFDVGSADAAASAFVGRFDLRTLGACEDDAGCVADFLAMELDAFSRVEVSMIFVDVWVLNSRILRIFS